MKTGYLYSELPIEDFVSRLYRKVKELHSDLSPHQYNGANLVEYLVNNFSSETPRNPNGNSYKVSSTGFGVTVDLDSLPFLLFLDSLASKEEINFFLGRARVMDSMGLMFKGQELLRRLVGSRVLNGVTGLEYDPSGANVPRDLKYSSDPCTHSLWYNDTKYESIALDLSDHPCEKERCIEYPLLSQRIYDNYALLHDLLTYVDSKNGYLLWECRSELDYSGDTYSMAGFEGKMCAQIILPSWRLPEIF